MSDEVGGLADNSDVRVVDVGRIIKVLWRNKLFILFIALITGVIFSAYAISLPDQYRAAARIVIEPDQTQATGLSPIDASRPVNEAMIESIGYMVTSNRILDRVVTNLKLESIQIFLDSVEYNGVLATIETEDRIRHRLAMKKLNESLTVRPIGESFVIAIEATTRSPTLSAEIANSVAETFIAFEQNIRIGTAQAANKWLLERLEDLRTRVNDSSRAYETFRAEMGEETERRTRQLSRLLEFLGEEEQQPSGRLSDETADADRRARIERANSEVRELTSQKIKLDELKRQAEADQVLYERLLDRARELQELETFQTSGLRLVVDALPPLEKHAPQRRLIVILGVILGLAIGSGVVAVRETL